MNKQLWTIAFLGGTFGVIAMELFAAFDSDVNTIPWTYYIADYIPMYITFPIIFFGAVWLFKHFIDAYKEKGERRLK